MSKSQQQKLEKNCSRKFISAVKQLLPKRDCVVDFTIFLPVDNDGVVQVLAEVDRNEEPWEFQFFERDWQTSLSANRNDRDLFPMFKSFFRKHWKQIASSNKHKASGYLRVHDDTSSFSLSSGKLINDFDREDIRAVQQMRPYRKKIRRRPRKRPDSGIAIGWTIKRFCTFLDSEFEFDEENSALECGEYGVTAWFDDGRLSHLHANPPFGYSIAGVWLGLHVSDVEKIIGLPITEEYCSIYVLPRNLSDKLWRYPNLGLNLFFDEKDCLLMIQLTRTAKS